MTNQSPQEPQNPIPERRTKPAAGVTFDEMIAIIVAFSTIGAILFWSWGGRKANVAGNFGLGGQNSSFSANNTGVDIGKIDSKSNVDFGELESEGDSFKIVKNPSQQKSSTISAALPKIGSFSGANSQSYQVASRNKLAPLAGVSVLPGLINQNNKGQNVEIDVDKKNPASPPSKVDVPNKPDSANPPLATAPDKPEPANPPQAAAPKKKEIPNDIVPSYWAYPFVKQMSDQALVPDFTEDQNFEPDKLITRAGMATLISQAFDDKPKNEDIKPFRDVSDQNAISADVDQAVRMGFMQGYSEDTFRPLENIPRYQVLVTLATGLGLKPSQDADAILQKFGDGSDMPDWAKQQVAAAAESGLIVNRPDIASNSLSPNESATRAEVAAMIHQALVKTGKLKSLDSKYVIKP